MQTSIFFLRKSKNFNKSRYSRNRQTTRVAFYFSLLVNIIVIFAVFSLYYKFLIKLAMLWWPFYFFLFSFFFSAYLRTTTYFSINYFYNYLKNFISKKSLLG